MKKTFPAISPYESELILAHILKKTREYVLTHLYPVTKIANKRTSNHVDRRKNIKKSFGDGAEIRLNKAQDARFKKMIARRKNHEPLAYVLGHKEFYGLDFKVDKNTLIPRPETELLVEEILKLKPKNTTIIDVGTGSGNIIISLAHNIEHRTSSKINFLAIDTSPKALAIAKQNAEKNKVNKKIKFLKGNLLEPAVKNCSMLHVPCSIIIVANLPYLSEKIYSSTQPNVKNFEPKSALLSGHDGLDHYRKLSQQIKKLRVAGREWKILLEISPEQKTKLEKIVNDIFPKSILKFKKDLAGKWRVAIIDI